MGLCKGSTTHSAAYLLYKGGSSRSWVFWEGLVIGLAREWHCPLLQALSAYKGGNRREGKGSLAESSGGGGGSEGGDAKLSSFTEWWPVCFGKLQEGVGRG